MQAGIIRLVNMPSIVSSGAIVGKKEHEGPLGKYFGQYDETDEFGMPTWEQSESEMQRLALNQALESGNLTIHDVDAIFAGDLMNQCTSSGYGLANFDAQFFGLFGACSTIIEGISLGSMLVDSGKYRRIAAVTSSHNCSAERQFRFPIEYGGQRPPTAQWTATASGSAVLGMSGDIQVRHATVGRIVDLGVTDMTNMGAAMAPAAYDTLCALFCDTRTKPEDYDLIVTGDLGRLGHQIVSDFFARDGLPLGERYTDCGLLLYDIESQDMHCGGSGCGCSASVLCGYLLRGMREGKWNRIIFAPTGALLSPTTTFQGESIPGICHAVVFSNHKEG